MTIKKRFYRFCINDTIWLGDNEKYIVGIVTKTDLKNQRVELSLENPAENILKKWYDLTQFSEFGFFHKYVPEDFYKYVGTIIRN